MPKSIGGLVSLIITSVISFVIGAYIVNRVPFLSNLISGRRAA